MNKNKIFYGWVVVFAGVMLVFLDGLLLYSFGMLLPSIQSKFDLTKALVNSIFAIRCLVFAFSMVVFGRLIDKHTPEKIIFLGGVITALGLFLTAYSETKIGLFINYGILPGIGDGAFYIPAVAIAQRWFNKRRDFVVGIITAGVPISGLIINPLSAFILKNTSLELTLISLAIIAFIFSFAAFLMKGSPKEMGLEPYGGLNPMKKEEELQVWSTMEAVKTVPFFILYSLMIFGMLAFLIIITLQFDYALSKNLGLLAASAAPAAIAVGSLCGRLVTGYLAEFTHRNKILFVVFLGQGLSILIITNANDILSYIIFGIIFGFCYGGWIPIFPSKLKDFFGTTNAGQIFGVFGTSFSISAIIGPPLAGFLVDQFHTYSYGLYFSMIVCLIGASMTLFVKKPIK